MATLCIMWPLPSKHLVSLLGDTICVRSSHRLLSSSKICSNKFSVLGISPTIDVGACGVVGVINSLVTGVTAADCSATSLSAWCFRACRVCRPPVSTSRSRRCPKSHDFNDLVEFLGTNLNILTGTGSGELPMYICLQVVVLLLANERVEDNEEHAQSHSESPRKHQFVEPCLGR